MYEDAWPLWLLLIGCVLIVYLILPWANRTRIGRLEGEVDYLRSELKRLGRYTAQAQVPIAETPEAETILSPSEPWKEPAYEMPAMASPRRCRGRRT